jgi:hypothetical protein
MGDADKNFIDSTRAGANSAGAALQRSVTESNKNTNIKNELNMEINADGGKNGKTGLTATQIAELANTAVKAQFNIQFKKALIGN